MTSVMAKKGQEVGWLGGWVAGAGNHALTLLPIKQPLLHKNKNNRFIMIMMPFLR